MALAHAGVLGKSFGTEEFGAYGSVTDVGLCAVAVNARGVAAEDADVVEHCCLFDKAAVDVQFGVCIDDGESLECYAMAMNKEDVAQRVVLLVVFVYDFLIVHYYSCGRSM